MWLKLLCLVLSISVFAAVVLFMPSRIHRYLCESAIEKVLSNPEAASRSWYYRVTSTSGQAVDAAWIDATFRGHTRKVACLDYVSYVFLVRAWNCQVTLDTGAQYQVASDWRYVHHTVSFYHYSQ
jgi:hypothetical protein